METSAEPTAEFEIKQGWSLPENVQIDSGSSTLWEIKGSDLSYILAHPVVIRAALDNLLCPPLIGGSIKRCFCLSVWRLSVAYIGRNSRTERPRKTKIGTEIAHVTRDSNTTFKTKRSNRFAQRGFNA